MLLDYDKENSDEIDTEAQDDGDEATDTAVDEENADSDDTCKTT